MHATVYIGATKEIRRQEITKQIAVLSVADIDVVQLADTESSIGISAVRDFQKRMFMTPYVSAHTAAVIYDMETMTIEAQNALLKTLEEPPPHVVILAETKHKESLLPTIISRVRIHQMDHVALTADPGVGSMLSDLFASGVGHRLTLIGNIATTRDETKSWVHQALIVLRQKLLESYETPGAKGEAPRLARQIRKLEKTGQLIEANVNPKLALGNAFLD